MFIETCTYNITEDKSIILAFIKSLKVKAFPCGRRRAVLRGASGANSYIPFDPEARLNTENNNRKHSGLNGFTQTYLADCTDNCLSFSLAGYSFSIEDFTDIDTLVDKAYEAIKSKSKQEAAKAAEAAEKVFNEQQFEKTFDENFTHLYANILIDSTLLFSGTPKAYYTDVLGSIANSDDESALDLLVSTKLGNTDVNADDYYFAGLTFSSSPLSIAIREHNSLTSPNFKSYDDYSFGTDPDKKRVISLCILAKTDNNGWVAYEPAKLPEIRHGSDRDSIVFGKAEVTTFDAETVNISHGNINADKLTQNGKAVPFIAINSDGDFWQLQITTDSSSSK